MTLHRADGGRERENADTDDLSIGWHTVELEWSPGRLRWSIDGEERMTVQGPEVPSEPMYLVANLAGGRPAGAPPSSTRFPATFLIDSVRVWQRA